MYARGTILGITRGTKREHIIRAALESIAYQSDELLTAIEEETGIPVQELKVDGGASANDFLMQFQSDIIGRPVRRPMIRETTALGAAYLAGLSVGFWRDLDELRGMWTLDRLYTPAMGAQHRQQLKKTWRKAVGRAAQWEEKE